MGKKKIILKQRPHKISDFYQKELNEQQLAAVTHKQGPALVIAGAGSGKTRMLTYRVAYLIEQGISPKSIILVTFTKKAAQEMIARVNNLIGNKAKGLYAGTFHHLANIILRKYAQKMGTSPNFTIMDRSDQNQLFKIIISANKPQEQKVRFPKPSQMGDIYSKQINLQKPLKEILDKDYPAYTTLGEEIKSILSIYKKQKEKSNLLDFDDLLTKFLSFLQNKDYSGNFLRNIRHILVDEYQDINAIQDQIVFELSRGIESVTIVGDDAQSIYAFRGGNFKHMLEFPDKYQNSTAYKLEINYRSTPEILNLANESIKHNKIQFQKSLQAVRNTGETPMLVPCKNLEQEA
ncbi:MAG: ATP-dependent helicase, partial [Promethearchaeota archaeon]